MVTPAPHPASGAARDSVAGPVAGDRVGEVGGIARLDLDRRRRTAVPEVVFADGKTEEQTLRLLAAQRQSEPELPALATRCPDGVLHRAASAFPTEPVLADPIGRTLIVGALPPARGFVAVLTGGTSDLPVAREAIATLQALGAGHRLIADIGVAGLHRLLAHVDDLLEADCVIAIAGMEGTLPGVVTGLIRAPVVGVPTSVGYGVSAGGQVAMATMLASCAPGLTVVNIDNGFGAAAHAVKIVAGCTVAEPGAAHLDCTAGVAGDMLLGAFLDAGADLAAVRAAVHSLGVPGLDVDVEQTRRAGLRCARAVVIIPASDQPTRGLAEVLAAIKGARLGTAAARVAVDTFRLLADAEAAVHGIPAELVQFHEVGAADALADVVGTAVAAEQLGLLANDALVTCSALAAGSGTARSGHGTIPVPAPAVLHIVSDRRLPLTAGNLAGERSTPTGVALVAVLATPGPLPSMTVDAVGSGAGHHDTADRPNITRLVIGNRTEPGPVPGTAEPVTVVETTVDDLDPELWPGVLVAVRSAGAWDCWTTATIGRHGRPGQVLTALCAEAVRPAVVDALFRHSTTLGVRWAPWQRTTLPRMTVPVPVGPPGAEQNVAVKVAARPGGLQTVKPELADAERAAKVLGWPVRRVCDAARSAYHRDHPAGAVAPRDN